MRKVAVGSGAVAGEGKEMGEKREDGRENYGGLRLCPGEKERESEWLIGGKRDGRDERRWGREEGLPTSEWEVENGEAEVVGLRRKGGRKWGWGLKAGAGTVVDGR